MTGLLDYIFYNLKERDLDRDQIEAYIRYLDELLQHHLPREKELAYRNMIIQLLSRLNKLKQEQIQFNPPKRKEKED